ncbi:hypothetical protein [Liquorilactobacillus sicerae]|uniref:hypothetical protein n=1 Tax=Liquorilactobacillus sicerae TaxID=1416943 RepID=UPI00248173AA|nr:hypothetical protein [Liquorilactobacillus sicerae]
MIFKKNQLDGILEDRGLANFNDNELFQVKNILSELNDQQLLKNSKKIISSDLVAEKATANYLKAIIEQNWVIINQNDQIVKQLAAKK